MVRLLVIEPDTILSNEYARALEREGFELVLCKDGQQAIRATDECTPDVILLEIALARNSGLEFLYELRSYGEWQNIPVVVLSRLSQEQSKLDERTLSNLGVHRYLYKPDTTLERLADTLNVGRAV